MYLNVLKLNIVMCIVLINIIVTNTCIKCTLNTNIHTTHDIKIYNEKKGSYLLNHFFRLVLFAIYHGGGSIPSTVPTDRSSTNRANDSKSLRILTKLCNCGIIMGSAPLPLAPKELFHWVLAYFTAKKHFHSWNGENVADEGNEGVDCVKERKTH